LGAIRYGRWEFARNTYLNALRDLSDSTEGVEGREGKGSELERHHGCLSGWFPGRVVRCKEGGGMSRKLCST
jgi:hypothetical protein